GTPGYMSPEQARGEKPLDPRTDVFALGCVLFAAVAGTPPYVADSVAGVLAKLLEHDPPRLASVAPGVPPEVDEVLFRMMSRSAAARPKDGDAVHEAIATILPNLPERSRSSTIPPALATLSPRERVVASVVAVQAEAGDKFRAEAALAPLGLTAFAEGGFLVAAVSRLGAPHDQAIQAAHLALALSDGMPEAAIGAASGWLELDADGRVHGDVLDRALSLATAPELIAIDEVTAALLDDRFVVEGRCLNGRRDFGPADVPDVSLLGRLPLRGPAGAGWPLVGRTRELAQLQSLVDECTSEPIARVALVVGAAGVGKTRVLREFLAHVGPEITVLASACERSRAGHPFAALPTLTTGSPTRRGAALDEKLAEALERGPVVVAVDDAQWGDDPSFRLLLAAAKKHASSPLLVLLCGRAEAKEAFFALGGRGAITQEVLVAAPSRKLLDDLAGKAGLDPAAASSATTPLELAALAGAPNVPWTRVFKQARLDALEAPLRRVVRACAICDERFDERGVLARIGAPEETITVRVGLDSLVAADILARDGDKLRFAEPELRDAARGMLATHDA
ncbi:MAG TPA: AAA family ATPase, partial [Polyangiaceae bacterium]|nr:AAA family ATPase [Polyangiaceae bacterium]